METSKEEVLHRLTQLKKELAKKQKKLEKSKRAANIRAHIRQKVIEINQIEKAQPPCDLNNTTPQSATASHIVNYECLQLPPLRQQTSSLSKDKNLTDGDTCVNKQSDQVPSLPGKDEAQNPKDLFLNAPTVEMFTNLSTKTYIDDNFDKLQEKIIYNKYLTSGFFSSNKMCLNNNVSDCDNKIKNVLESRKSEPANGNNSNSADNLNCLFDVSLNNLKLNVETNASMLPNEVSDSEFLHMLGVNQNGTSDSFVHIDNDSLGYPFASSSSEKENNYSSSKENRIACDRKSPLKFTQPNKAHSQILSSQSDYSDYTELDVIPFTKFELEEDFLSETLLNSNSPQKAHLSKFCTLIKRRSLRISQQSQDSLPMSPQKSFLKKKLSNKAKIVAIMSVFQFLKEEATKPKWSSDFDLPEPFDELKEKVKLSSNVKYDTLTHNTEQNFKNNLLFCHENPEKVYLKNKNVVDNVDIFNSRNKQSIDQSVINESNAVTSLDELIIKERTHLYKELNSDINKNVESIDSETITSQINMTSPSISVVQDNFGNPSSLAENNQYYSPEISKKIPNLLEEIHVLPSSLATSTPKTVKMKSKKSLSEALERSEVLFECDSQQDDVQHHVEHANEDTFDLQMLCSLKKDNKKVLEVINCDWVEENSNSEKEIKKLEVSAKISLEAFVNSPLRISHNILSGMSPMHEVQPWKKLQRTPVRPTQVMEDERNEDQLSHKIYCPARRLSRSQLSEPKHLKFSGCFQSCSQDAVINILNGCLVQQANKDVEYLVSIQATSLTVWTKDDNFGWTTELDWRLPPENHLFQAYLMPVKDKIAVCTCGWNRSLLFISLFIYDCQTEDTKRFNIEISELLKSIRAPSNALLTPVSSDEMLLGITNNVSYIIGKVNFFGNFDYEKTVCFENQRGQLLDIVQVTGQTMTSISLSSDQKITIWNTQYGFALKIIQLPVSMPCVTKLLHARYHQGFLLLETMWRVNSKCGGSLIINPLTGVTKILKSYDAPNSSWRCIHNAKIEFGLIAAISDKGSFSLWKRQDGKLLCHSKSNTATALSVIQSDQSLLVGEIQGCLHLYKTST